MNDVAIERWFKPLANRRRVAILRLLHKKTEVGVTAIAEHLGISLTATSRHLSMLERAGYLEKEQRSLNVYYRLSKDAPSILIAVRTLF